MLLPWFCFLAVLSPLHAYPMERDNTHNFFRNDDTCCPGKMGADCNIDDLCARMDAQHTCKNGGVCDALTGKCACPAGYSGETCTHQTCSGNGQYDPGKASCVCWEGWTGSDCSECLLYPEYKHRHVCFPTGKHGYVLWKVEEDVAKQWLGPKGRELLNSLLQGLKGSNFTRVAFPGKRDYANRYLDCECRVIPDTFDSRRASLTTDVNGGRSDSLAQSNAYLTGSKVYQHAGGTLKQTLVFEDVITLRRELEEAKNTPLGDLQEIMENGANRRLQLELNQGFVGNTRRMRYTRGRPDIRSVAAQIAQRKDEEETAARISKTLQYVEEKERLAKAYTQCTNVYQQTSRDLALRVTELELCQEPADESDCSQYCKRINVAFWAMLAAMVTVVSMVLVILILYLTCAIGSRFKMAVE